MRRRNKTKTLPADDGTAVQVVAKASAPAAAPPPFVADAAPAPNTAAAAAAAAAAPPPDQEQLTPLQVMWRAQWSVDVRLSFIKMYLGIDQAQVTENVEAAWAAAPASPGPGL